MFDFFFKRSPPKPVVPVAQAQPADAASVTSSKQAALAQAAALVGDEAAAAAFILCCPFADARLIAAAQLHSAAVLETVVQAMRNTDRRVAKLLQARLDELKQRARAQQQAQQCIATAQQLLASPRLMANQVVDIDHAWQSIVLADAENTATFNVARTLLGARLEQQARLQHDLLALLARLQQSDMDDAAPDMWPGILEESAHMLQHELTARETAALPPALMRDIEACRRSVQARLDAHASMPPMLLPAMIAPPIETPIEIQIETAPCVDASIPLAPQPSDVDAASAKQAFIDALEGIEKALQEGGLHAASEFDRSLRKLEQTALRIDEAQRRQLSAARAELNRLQAWARWGGNISREELLKAALALPGQTLAVTELAKKVGSLRERWKSLDTSAGPATNEAWRNFDAACSEAYAPAAAHYKKLAQEREQNLHNAEALISVVHASATVLSVPEATDWKQLAQLCTQHAQAWQRLGTIERKEKKRLDRAFAQAMQALLLPLDARRAEAITLREQLIAKIIELHPTDSAALETLRGAQERWQVEAKALPLERQDEQALWLRFRAACDAVFAARKQGAAAADDERRAHQQKKEAVCAALESALGDAEPAIATALRDAQAAWSRIGPVPRAVEKAIESRYQDAVAALQARLALARRVVRAAQSDALRDKLRLCQQAEAVVLGIAGTEADNAAEAASLWENLPALAVPFERALAARFAAAVQANASHAHVLEQNRTVLAEELLRCEILAGLDSPEEFTRSRLQLQVDVLQSALKAGQKPQTTQAQLLALCTLPAALDARDARRIERLIAHLQEQD
jgi:exonuclease SbcC